MKADQVLSQGQTELLDRAVTYDKPGGERSMARTVAMFNALTDQAMSVEQGWLLLACLKMVRSQQGAKKADNYVDGATYFALAGEEALSDPKWMDEEAAGRLLKESREKMAKPIVEKVDALLDKHSWIPWELNKNPPAGLRSDELVDVKLRNGNVSTQSVVGGLDWGEISMSSQFEIIEYRVSS